MTSRGESRLAPLLGVAQAMVILCLRSIFHIAYKCGTGGILVYSSSESHLCALGPRLFSCSTSMSYMPAALLFLSAAIPFLYSSSLNADTNDGLLI